MWLSITQCDFISYFNLTFTFLFLWGFDIFNICVLTYLIGVPVILKRKLYFCCLKHRCITHFMVNLWSESLADWIQRETLEVNIHWIKLSLSDSQTQSIVLYLLIWHTQYFHSTCVVRLFVPRKLFRCCFPVSFNTTLDRCTSSNSRWEPNRDRHMIWNNHQHFAWVIISGRKRYIT